MKKSSLIIGVDGGGSYTTGCIFDINGNTIKKYIIEGTNLSIYKELAISRLADFFPSLPGNFCVNNL